MSEAEAPTPWGAVPQDGRVWNFGVWAPGAQQVDLDMNGHRVSAERGGAAVFTARLTGRPGDPYRLIVDGRPRVDPAARWLTDGVGGPALLCPPPVLGENFAGRDWAEAAILEIHIGTFTVEGTFAAARGRMADLAKLGITAVQLMPVGALGGTRGWGYDGVLPFAVHPAYGSPQDLADLVDAIHAAGMMAFLDVVYNHFGPEGCSLPRIAPSFFDKEHDTPWGPGIDYTDPHVRAFFIDNALMWVRDFGFDGLRIDAVHHITDPSPVHILDEMAQTLREEISGRPVHLIAEDDRNLPEARNSGTITANWNDDYHHAVHCLLTGESESYYASFAVDPMADLVRALGEGHVEQGQKREGREGLRGAPSGHLPPTAFVNANQTHDQVGNRANGERLISLADPAEVRIAHAMLLTAPAVPMLFMGEEEGSHAPFLFFADFRGELGAAIRRGRAQEFAGFSGFGGTVPDPLSPETFAAARPYDDPAPDADTWRVLTRRCLEWRAATIVPLLRSGRADKPEIRATGARSLHAIWHFGAGRLEMVTHLGGLPDHPVPLGAPDIAIGGVTDPCHFAVRANH